MQFSSRHRSGTGLFRRSAVLASSLALVISGGVAFVSNTSASAASRSVLTADLARAKAYATQLQKRPTSIGIATPITKPIPSGKNITCIVQVTPGQLYMCSAAKDAASLLGWTETTLTTDGSLTNGQQVFQTALNNGTNGIILEGQTMANLTTQMAAAVAAKVPVVDCCDQDIPGTPGADGLLYQVSTDNVENVGRILAANIVSLNNNIKSPPHVLYINLPAIAVETIDGQAGAKWLKTYSPQGSWNLLNIPITSLGATATNAIVSYLRSHPKINYVVPCLGSLFSSGLPQALAAAGLSKVKIIANGPGLTDYSYIASGQEMGTLNYPYAEVVFDQMDAFARYYAGMPQIQDPPLPKWFVTKKTLPSSTNWFANDANYRSQFIALWSKGLG